jgi:hypothetical protein
MKAGSVRVVVILLFMLALVAGVAAGLLASRYAARPASTPISAAPALSDLDLSADQAQRIRTLWEKVKEDSDQSYVQVNRLQQQQQQDLINLLTEDQKRSYSRINLDYQNKITKLKADRDLALKNAFEETRKLLSPVQRDRYDGILKSRFGSNADPTGEARPAVRTSMPSAGLIDSSSRESGT